VQRHRRYGTPGIAARSDRLLATCPARILLAVLRADRYLERRLRAQPRRATLVLDAEVSDEPDHRHTCAGFAPTIAAHPSKKKAARARKNSDFPAGFPCVMRGGLIVIGVIAFLPFGSGLVFIG
jgi:hypothetical protein